MTLDYDAACKSATTAQGLDPVIARLTEEGIDHRLEQTGGFCMAVVIPRHTRVYVITRDGEDPNRPYTFGTYMKQAWEDTGDALTYKHAHLEVIIEWLNSPQYQADYSGRRGRKRQKPPV